MTKSIFLSNGKECLVDDADYPWASQYKWHENTFGYAGRQKQVRGIRAGFKMHRELVNAPKGLDVDHINGNKLDNRRVNLRLATRQENARNKRAQKNNKCGYKGVSPSGKKFRASIRINKKQIHLGMFATSDAAAHARDKAEKEMFGEFANCNFSEGSQ